MNIYISGVLHGLASYFMHRGRIWSFLDLCKEVFLVAAVRGKHRMKNFVYFNLNPYISLFTLLGHELSRNGWVGQPTIHARSLIDVTFSSAILGTFVYVCSDSFRSSGIATYGLQYLRSLHCVWVFSQQPFLSAERNFPKHVNGISNIGACTMRYLKSFPIIRRRKFSAGLRSSEPPHS